MVKLKLKVGGSTVGTPKAPASPAPAEPSSRPKIKLSSTQPSTPTAAKTKTPTIRFKPVVARPKFVYTPGNGYDSESSEREQDPTIEEQFIFRMQPGDDCELLRKAVEERTLDTNSEVFIKFKDQRHAVVGIKGRLYGAILWDLPCIIESVKTLDRKSVFKTADICHMLEVQGRINHESEVFSYPITDYAYPHGLTAPLKYVRKRRFRKPRYERPIDDVHEDVRRLLLADAEAIQTSNELVDVGEMIRMREEAMMYDDVSIVGQQDTAQGASFAPTIPDDGEDEDAPGEVDMEEDFDLFNELNAALLDEDGNDAGEGASGQVSGDADADADGDDDDSSDDDLFEDDDNEGGGGQFDDSAHEAAQEKQKIREELSDLKSSLHEKERELEKTTNPIIQGRIRGHIANYKAEIKMKEQMLKGNNDDDDDEMADG